MSNETRQAQAKEQNKSQTTTTTPNEVWYS